MLSINTIRIFTECTKDGMINVGSMIGMITNELPNINTEGPDIDVDADTILRKALRWSTDRTIKIMTTRELMSFISEEYDVAYSESLSMLPQPPNPMMTQYGPSLTYMAAVGKINEMVNRNDETAECINILSCMRRNSVILTGTSGCGRRTIINGLATLLATHDVPMGLSGREIYKVSTKELTSELTHRGELDERIAAIAMMSMAKDYIIYMDSMIEAMEPMPGERRSILDVLEEYVTEGLSIIGVATPEEYHRITRGHQMMMENFQRIKVEIPEDECITEILRIGKVSIEEYHGVSIPLPMTKEVIRLSQRYIPSNSVGGMLDILDSSSMIASQRQNSNDLMGPIEEWSTRILDGKYMEAAANIPHIHHIPNSLPVEVVLSDITEAIHRRTGKDISPDDLMLLGSLEEELNATIVNQETQISKVCRLLRTAYVFRSMDKPLASLLLIGVPGCGKTYLAQTIAKIVFGGDILIINMENFQEKFTVSRLLGSPPGYVGYDEGGIIPNWLREHPSSVILFDEVEKAHEDVYNILLGMMDQGQITDMQGTRHSLSESLILMTSNVGSKHVADGYSHNLGFGGEAVDNGKEVQRDIRTAFSPAFLDRLSGQIQFNKLVIEDIRKILELELEMICRTSDLDITITPGARSIVLEGWKENDGARGISRLITRDILEPISSLVIGDGGNVIRVYSRGGKILFRIT